MRNNFTEKWSRLFAAKRHHSETGTIELSPLEQQELLDDAQSLDRWIPVDQALPEDYNEVLYFDSRDETDHVGYFVPSQSQIPNYVTHWMSLPNKPKL